jgi:hypothetical protein
MAVRENHIVKKLQVREALKRNGYRYRVPRFNDMNNNTSKSKISRFRFAHNLLENILDNRKLMYLDESSFNSSVYHHRQWCLNTRRSSRMKRFENVTLLAACTEGGDYFYCLSRGGTNEDVFHHFLMKLHQRLLELDPNYRSEWMIVMDNVPIHKTNKLRRWIE